MAKRLNEQSGSIKNFYNVNHQNMVNHDCYQDYSDLMKHDLADLQGDIKVHSMLSNNFYYFILWTSIFVVAAILIHSIFLRLKAN